MENANLQLKVTKLKDMFSKFLKYFIAISYAVIALFPFLWMISNSFRNNQEIFSAPFALPKSFRINNYIEAWSTAKIGTYFLNSVIVSFSAVLVLIVFASMASYIIARVKPNNLIYTYFTLGIMIPIHAMLIPTFIMLRKVDLLNNRAGLSIVYMAANMALSIFILVGFMRGIPKEMEEAAEIDGAGIYRTFFSIILPISKPGIATIGTLSFLNAWNDFLYAQVLMVSPAIKTLTQGIQNLKGQYSTDYGLMSAGLVITIIPVVVVYILFQEQVVKGMTAGAVKG